MIILNVLISALGWHLGADFLCDVDKWVPIYAAEDRYDVTNSVLGRHSCTN